MHRFAVSLPNSHLVASDSLLVARYTAPAPVTADPWIGIWQRHYATDQVPVICPSIARTVFDPEAMAVVSSRLAELGDRPVTLIFVHRGHQRHYRSPVLPHFLALLPDLAFVMTLRARDDAVPDAALTLCTAALATGEACLLINDRTPRLSAPGTAGTNRGGLDYSLFLPANEDLVLHQEPRP